VILNLKRPAWDQHEIGRVVASNKTRYVVLEDRLPVLLYYLTAKADENGRLEFRPDIYGRDPALRRALNGPPSELRIGFVAPSPLVDPEAVQTAGPERPGGTQTPAPVPGNQPAPPAGSGPGVTLTQGARPARGLNLDLPPTPASSIPETGAPPTRL